MSIIPAKVAGVERVAAATPPGGSDGPNPYTIYTMYLAGADEIYCLGGVQAIAALALGTETIERADMIVGPGNAYVAEAKRQLFGRVGIDLVAGPTEILVIADANADPSIVAADLLAQAEHGPTSPSWLITTSEDLGRRVLDEIDRQLQELATADVAGQAWRDFGEVVVVDSDEEAVQVADAYAPEHLEVQTEDWRWYLDRLRNYGSLFLGEMTTVAYGDKTVGTNHILPTVRNARFTGGLWVGKFLKTCTYQHLDVRGTEAIAPVVSRQSGLEGFAGHKASADRRLAKYGLLTASGTEARSE
jgi:sulfopropanediol 3-dehydrogenase